MIKVFIQGIDGNNIKKKLIIQMGLMEELKKMTLLYRKKDNHEI